MHRSTLTRLLIIALALALSACGGGSDKSLSDLLAPGHEAALNTDGLEFTSVYDSDATRRLGSAARPDRAELMSDAPALLNEQGREIGLSGVVTYPQGPEYIESEVVPEAPELIGSKSVVPGPPAEELAEFLNQELARLGIDPAKSVSAPPSGNENTVLDLEAVVVDPDGAGGNPPTGIELIWTEVFVGDYDQNTEVSISDLSPLGNKFMGTVTYIGDVPAGDPDEDGGTDPPTPPSAGSGADNWRLWRIDGDTNGEINIADITPIATHFAQSLTGYRIYRKGPGDATFVLMDDPLNPGSALTAPRSYAQPVDPNRPVRYHFTDAVSEDGNYEYYVVPFDAASSQEGVESLHADADFSTAPPLEPPVAALTAVPLIGLGPLTVNFDASASTDSDGTITQYEWDWENDGTFDDDTGATATNSHEYTVAGFFVATVRARDNDGLTDTASVNIEVQANGLPTAVLTAAPTAGLAPLEVDFDATGSSDPDGTIVKFEWDWEGDGTYDADTGTTGTNTFTYTTPGPKQATVRVTDDGGGTATAMKLITVSDPGTSTLFDVALAGVEMERADLTLGAFPDQVGFDGYVNHGNDTTGFNLNAGDGDTDFDDPGEIVPGSRFGSFTNYWHNDHTALPVWAQGHGNDLAGASSLEQIIQEANDVFFEGDERQTFFAPPTAGIDYIPGPADPFAQAVIDMSYSQGGTPNEVAIFTDGSDIPNDVQIALARVVLAADAAATARDNFLENDTYWSIVFGPYDPLEPPETNIWHIAFDTSHAFRVPIDITYLWSFILFGLTTEDGGTTWLPLWENFAATYAYDEMAQSALDLSHALDDAAGALLSATGTWSFDQDTPLGRIMVNSGSGDTTYSDDEYLLICDIDGNDTYNCPAGANAGIFNSVSINIDITGNDIYAALDDYQDAEGLANDTHSQQGTGRLGVGMLVDYAGNDTYSASLTAQGCGILGWGLLYDAAGDDTYFGVDHVQGSSLCGVGILYDSAGVDSYECWSASQGYGDIWGLGILSDLNLDSDTYFAQWDATVGPANFASPQNPDINANFSQGAAFGLRTTATFPVIWDGGVGMLQDNGGANALTCGVFGQGHGFWFATGVCDLGGTGGNSLDGVWYTQGAGAHFAAGLLRGASGADGYNVNWETRGFPLQNVMLAGAHDHSVSWFLDDGGADTYRTPTLGLGTGNVNGWAYFIDMGPDLDDYGLTDVNNDALTLGRGHLSSEIPDGDPLEGEITFGLFLDCGGVDVYDGGWASLENGDQPVQSAGNDRGWFRFGYTNDFANDWRANEFGTGYDGEGTSGFEP